MKFTLKRIFMGVGLCALVYIALIAHFYWKWLQPDTPLPTGYESVGESKLYNENYLELSQNISQLISKRAKQWSAPSLSVAVAINNELVWAGAKGYADVDKEVPAKISSLYRAGSVSKSLTALSLGRLMDAGKIDIDESIHHYLPDFPKFEADITSRMLGNHTAGFRHYGIDVTRWPAHEFFIDTPYASVSDSLSIFSDDELEFIPDQGFGYSSYGYNLLSAVMESAANKDFLTLMQGQVFTPLNMKHTLAIPDEPSLAQVVQFYTSGAGQYGNAYPVDLSHKWAGGGFMSTPSDLVKAGIALFEPSFLSQSTRETLLKPVEKKTKGQDPRGYALGWENTFNHELLASGEKIQTIFHSGGSVGGSAYLLIIPEYNVVVAALTNTSGDGEGPFVDELSEEIAAMILNSGKYNTHG